MFAIRINPVDFDDWAGLLNLLHESFAYMNDRIDPPSSLHKLDLDGIESKAKQENLIVISKDGLLAGCAFFKPLGDAMYIGKVAVSSEFRQQGLAKAMFDEIEKIAVIKNIERLQLETRVELIENHQTFRTMGFKKVAETAHPGYDRATSIIMEKMID